MKFITYKVANEEHLMELDKLVSGLKFVHRLEPSLITPSEMALGIGRPLSDEEWDLYFETYPNRKKGKSGDEILEKIKK